MDDWKAGTLAGRSILCSAFSCFMEISEATAVEEKICIFTVFIACLSDSGLSGSFSVGDNDAGCGTGGFDCDSDAGKTLLSDRRRQQFRKCSGNIWDTSVFETGRNQ